MGKKLLVVIFLASFGLGSPGALAKSKAKTKAKSDVEEKFVSGCFKNYLTQVQKKSSKNREKALRDIKKKCFTVAFRTEWKSTGDSKKIDPVTRAKENKSSWTKNVKVTFKNSKKTSGSVMLGKGRDKQCVSFKLAKKEEDLKISSLRKCQ
jgi:hypothetical protein